MKGRSFSLKLHYCKMLHADAGGVRHITDRMASHS
jgi:hypothetical protein